MYGPSALLDVRPEATEGVLREEEDEHPVDQGQTEQAQVHPVLQTCTEESHMVHNVHRNHKAY